MPGRTFNSAAFEFMICYTGVVGEEVFYIQIFLSFLLLPAQKQTVVIFDKGVDS